MTRAEETARLKCRHPMWWIERRDSYVEAASGPGGATSVFLAKHRATGQLLRDTSAAGLEGQLNRVEASWAREKTDADH